MKTTVLFKTLTLLGISLSVALCQGQTFTLITAAQSGNWSDPNTWTGGIVPGVSNSVDIEGGIEVMVDTNVTLGAIEGFGTVTMVTNSTLVLLQDPMINATITLNATASNSTVIYTGNPYNAYVCDYYNLWLANTNWTPIPPYDVAEDFNNFASATASTPTPMTIYGNMYVLGYIKVQGANVKGVAITVNGNLTIGSGCAWDTSTGTLIVQSNLYLGGCLEDLDAAGSNYIGGNLVITGPSTPWMNAYPKGPLTNGWYFGDGTNWIIGGSLTNDGAVYGTNWGTFFLNGSGSIGGSNTLTVPYLTINGSYTLADSIVLKTNNANLNGTLIFDLANTNNITLVPSPGFGTTLTNYYNGNLVVIDTGAAPTAGQTYKLFSGAHYTGVWNSVTLPSLPAGLNWVNDLLTDGSLVVGGTPGAPVLTVLRNGNQLSLSWNSVTYPGYSVVAQTNRGLGTVWSTTGSGTTSPYNTTIDTANPGVYYRLYHQ
jgi:hypothetical protein